MCAGADLPARRGARRERASPSVTRNGGTTSSARCWRPTSCTSRPRSCRRGSATFTRVDLESFKIEDESQGLQLSHRRAAGMAPGPARRAAARAARGFPRHAIPGACCWPRIRPAGAKCCSRCCARMGSSPQASPSWHEFVDSKAPFALCVAPEMAGLNILTPPIAVLGEAQLFGQRARQERRRRRAASDPQAILRDLTALGPGLAGRARRIWRRPLPRPAGHAGGRAGRRVRGARIRRRRQAVRARAAAAPGLALLGRRAGKRAAAQARHRPMGQGAQTRRRQDPRRGRRAARPVRAAPGETRAGHCRNASSSTRPSRAAFRSRKPPTRPRPSARCCRTSRREKPMDRVVCGDVGFGKTEVAMRAAFIAAQAGKQVAVLVPTTLLAEQHTNNFRDRFADWPVRIEIAVALPHRQGIECGARRHRARHRRHRHRHAPAAARQRPLQGPRAHHRRRGTSLRRARQGEAQDAARRSARAHAHGHADSAHAEHGAGRPARSVVDHHAARRAARHQDLRHRVARADAARGGAARVPARRPGVLRAQRGRDHREDGAGNRQARCPRPKCASAMGRCASATSNSSWSISITGASTSWCAPPSSKAASTCPPPTPS